MKKKTDTYSGHIKIFSYKVWEYVEKLKYNTRVEHIHT